MAAWAALTQPCENNWFWLGRIVFRLLYRIIVQHMCDTSGWCMLLRERRVQIRGRMHTK